MMAKIEVVVKARAFSSESARNYRFCVDLSDNEIMVWDRVAGHFTKCHRLSVSAKRRIIERAVGRYEWCVVDGPGNLYVAYDDLL